MCIRDSYGTAQDEYLISCIYVAKMHALTAKAGRYGGGTWTKWYAVSYTHLMDEDAFEQMETAAQSIKLVASLKKLDGRPVA